MATPIKNLARLGIFLLLVYLVGGANLSFIFLTFAPVIQIIFLCVLLVFVFFGSKIIKATDIILLPSDRTFIATMLLVAFSVIAAANIFVFEKVPHVTDSIAYLYMAKSILAGYLAPPAGIMPEFFIPHFYYIENGNLISSFQPGWPLVLSIGEFFNAPWIVNPILGAISIVPGYKIALRILDKKYARFAIILLVLSPFYIYMSASFMAHTLSGLLGLIAICQVLAYLDDQKFWRVIVISLAVGFLFNVRILNALLLFVPLAFLILPALIKPRIKLKHLVTGLLIAASLVSIQFVVNHHYTGDAFRFAPDEYFEKTELVPTCHRLGFGDDIGCASEHGRYSFPKGFYPSDALGVTKQRLQSLSLNLFGTPLIMIFLLAPFAIGAFNREVWLMYIISASLIAGYFTFYYHGNCYGPRFYYEAVVPFCILISLGAFRLNGYFKQLSENHEKARKLLRALIPALLASILIFNLGWLHSTLFTSYQGFRGIDGQLEQVASQAKIKNAVVLLHGIELNFGYGVNFNDPLQKSDIIYALHHYNQSVQLMYAFPDRDFYRYAPFREQMVKLKKHVFEGVIFFEAESKLPPYKVQNGFVSRQYILSYKGGDNKDVAQAYFKATRPDAYFTIKQYIFESGDYKVEADVMHGAYIGNWQMEINGQKLLPAFKGYQKQYGFELYQPETVIYLERGMAEITFRLTGKAPAGLGYGIGVDFVVLRKVPEGIGVDVPQIEDMGYIENGKLILLEDGEVIDNMYPADF